MTREEEIINAAKTFEKEEGFSPIVMKVKGVNSAAGIGFLEGAAWADKHPYFTCKWNEEDEEMKRAIIENIFILKKMFRQEEMQTDYNRMIEWLKSLKQRMEE